MNDELILRCIATTVKTWQDGYIDTDLAFEDIGKLLKLKEASNG